MLITQLHSEGPGSGKQGAGTGCSQGAEAELPVLYKVHLKLVWCPFYHNLRLQPFPWQHQTQDVGISTPLLNGERHGETRHLESSKSLVNKQSSGLQVRLLEEDSMSLVFIPVDASCIANKTTVTITLKESCIRCYLCWGLFAS